MTEPLVIFLHVPKTGGSTVREALRRAVGPERFRSPNLPHRDTPYVRYLCEERDDHSHPADGNVGQLDRWRALADEERANTRVLAGHYFYGIHEHVARPSTYVAMVRAPVERILSLYAHRVRTQDLRAPLERYLTYGREVELDNGQTRRLATRGWGAVPGPVTQTMLDGACEHVVEQFAAIGVTERFGESMLAVGRVLGGPLLAYDWENRGTGRPTREDLPRHLLDDLVELNRFDAALHAFAAARLDDALRDVDVAGDLRRLERDARRVKWEIRLRRGIYPARAFGGRTKRALRNALTRR